MQVDPRLLKRDALGTITIVEHAGAVAVARDANAAAPALRCLARWLARREARALGRLANIEGVAKPIACADGRLVRTYLPGQPMHRAEPPGAEYFAHARRVLRKIHHAGVVHNDLAKEANWLCLPGQRCAIVDFQLAGVFRRRGRLFRLLAREDIRHLLKHKRQYAPAALTRRELAILAHPSLPARFWRRCFKPLYHLATRRLLGWPERLGAEER